MANKKKRDEDWVEAKRRCRLNQDDIRMAKELGMNPRSLIKNIPSKSQQWKAPVKYWIRDLYERQQTKTAARRSSKLHKSSPALAESASRSSSKPIPSDVDLRFDDDSIPADLDSLADYDSIPADVDFLFDDEPIPVNADSQSDDDSLPF